MGITSLLPFLERSTFDTNLQDLRGCRVAVDVYCLLHKGATICAQDLVMGRDNKQYLTYVMKYVDMFLRHKITPIMVFDGMHLPAKQITEVKRREQRAVSRKEAFEYLSLGKKEEARRYFLRCVDINHEMASNVIQACRKLRIDCIVAPYEADSQLAYLNRAGFVDFVISEDSDLLLFGCEKVLYKLNLDGNGRMVVANTIFNSMGLTREKFTFDKFLYMCILSGCDYLDSLPGIGLKKALKFLKITAEEDPAKFLGKLPQYLNMKQLVVTDTYKKGFLRAAATFRHQVVFDVQTQKLGRLNPITDPIVEAEYCDGAGNLDIAVDPKELALGNYDPFTLKRVNDFTIDLYREKRSIWNKDYVNGHFKQTDLNSNQLADMTQPKPQVIIPVRTHRTQAQAQRDLELEAKLKEELKIYEVPDRSQESKPIEIKMDEELQNDGRISPVLNYNPFRRNNSANIVESRHFSSSVETFKSSLSEDGMSDLSDDPDPNIDPGTFLVQSMVIDEGVENVFPVVEPYNEFIPPPILPLTLLEQEKDSYEPPKKKSKYMRQTKMMDFFKTVNNKS